MKKAQPDDYLPERKKYEQLCRGEGLRMVRRERRLKHSHLLHHTELTLLVLSVRLLEGRAASSAVTTTTTATPNTSSGR